MSSAKHRSQEQPLEVLTKQQSRFVFPIDSHLLITTRSCICAWDSTDLHTIFQSKNGGIVAAREARDRSGVVAVADKHVVVLHDTKRGREGSWGLEADGDEVRHLEYTTDAKSLFLSTNLTTDIQCYSTEGARLLSPSQTHASPPVALAVSPTGHLMVSASDGPPLVYLKNLTHNTTPVLIEPRASKAAVSVVSFHPERPNIFLLAFRDGTLAAYDATKMIRSEAGSVANQEDVNKCEISHLAALHRASSVENKRAPITDAAFLPGFKTRVVSVGSDGRCRLVDFANGGEVLRTWHAKAPVTSVSVLSMASGGSGQRSKRSGTSHVYSVASGTDSLIAIGRADGQIHIYDSVGLLLSQRSLGADGEKIISVAWASGSSPKPIVGSNVLSVSNDLPRVALGDGKDPKQEIDVEKKPTMKVNSDTNSRSETTPLGYIGLPPELRKVKSGALKSPDTGPTRRFTVHPDEVEDGTVRHTPLPHCYKPGNDATERYLDLFSPVKPAETKPTDLKEKRLSSPPRSRPALTSQTFIKSPEPAPTTRNDSMIRQRNLALFPSTDSGSGTADPVAASGRADGKISTMKKSPPAPTKHITFQEDSRRRSRKSASFKTSSEPPNSNAKVLAELRKLNSGHPAYRSAGTLSSYRPLKIETGKPSSTSKKKETKFHFLRRQADHIETEHDSDTARKVYEHVHKRRHWPEDSEQETSLDDDIWLTSASDEETKQSRRRRKQPVQRPLARQTSRSGVTSKGTMSTLDQQPADVASASAQRLHKFDGSTEEDMFTADTHVTSTGSFSPSSRDVRELFPRSSSLSPRKSRTSEKRSKPSPSTLDRNLREIATNEAAGRLAKSPWARARAGKVVRGHIDKSLQRTATKPIEVFQENLCATDWQKEPSDEPHCSICGPTKARVNELEAEVARLKGEVLVFKAVLRRQGVALPASLRGR